MNLSPTPFHARTAAHNPDNVWVRRGAFTVPAHYGDPHQEALAARVSTVLCDISPREDLRVHGQGAAAMLSAAFGFHVAGLEDDDTRRVHWCADGGGLRGAGILSRLGETDYLLASHDADLGWFAPAAPRFGASLRDVARERGVLLLAGPFAFAVLAAAGLEEAVHLPRGHQAVFDWRGVRAIICRRGPLAAYQIACASADAPAMFDRLMRAGPMFGLRLAGQEALELLQIESGALVPGLDFAPAREPLAREPVPSWLGFAAAPAAGSAARKLVGVELDSDEPAPFAAILSEGAEVGHTMRSAYSPALGRAIALASVEAARAEPGTAVTLRARLNGARDTTARIVALPFLR